MARKIRIDDLRRKKTPDELREAFKHITWGMRYLSEKLEFVLRLNNSKNRNEIIGITAAVHESFLIHARRMIEFLYCETNDVYQDDIIAEDYFENWQKWRDLRPAKSDLIKESHEKMGKLFVHFTYKSLSIPDGKITWSTSDIYVDIFRTFQKFITNVDASLLDDDAKYLREGKDIMICYPITSATKGKYQIASRRDLVSEINLF